MKIFELVQSVEALQTISREKMAGKLAYKIAKSIRLVDQELADYEKGRIAICEKYGKLSEDKSQYIFEGDAQQLADAEVRELGETEVDIPILKLTIAEIESLNVMPATLMALEWMIEEEQPKK